MSTRIGYQGQIAAKLDYAALEKKLASWPQREPPRKRKTAADVLEPLRERLLALHRKGLEQPATGGGIESRGYAGSSPHRCANV